MKYLVYFFIGGITLSLMKYIADKLNPQYNAFLYTTPVVFIGAVYFSFLKNSKKNNTNRFIINNIFLMVLSTLYILFMYLFYNRKNTLLNSILHSFIVWLILAIIYIKFIYIKYLQ